MPVTTLATVAQVQARAFDAGSVHAAELAQLVASVTKTIENYCNRILMRQATRTDYLTGDGSDVLSLPLYPIESVTSVTIASDRSFDGVTALTVEDDYRFEPETGLLYYMLGDWPEYRRGIKVVYVGGYVHPDDTPTGAQISLPTDLTEACIQQCVHWCNRRSDYGTKGEKAGDGAVTFIETGLLLPSVKGLCAPYKRYSI